MYIFSVCNQRRIHIINELSNRHATGHAYCICCNSELRVGVAICPECDRAIHTAANEAKSRYLSQIDDAAALEESTLSFQMSVAREHWAPYDAT